MAAFTVSCGRANTCRSSLNLSIAKKIGKLWRSSRNRCDLSFSLPVGPFRLPAASVKKNSWRAAFPRFCPFAYFNLSQSRFLLILFLEYTMALLRRVVPTNPVLPYSRAHSWTKGYNNKGPMKQNLALKNINGAQIGMILWASKNACATQTTCLGMPDGSSDGQLVY